MTKMKDQLTPQDMKLTVFLDDLSEMCFLNNLECFIFKDFVSLQSNSGGFGVILAHVCSKHNSIFDPCRIIIQVVICSFF